MSKTNGIRIQNISGAPVVVSFHHRRAQTSLFKEYYLNYTPLKGDQPSKLLSNKMREIPNLPKGNDIYMFVESHGETQCGGVCLRFVQKILPNMDLYKVYSSEIVASQT